VRYLLDTHILLWARSAPDKLSDEVLAVLKSADNDLHVSMATLWECAIKSAMGKLDIPESFHRIVADSYRTLDIEVAHLEAHTNLPLHHRDPFDRMLIAQAQSHDLIVLTQDSIFARYDVRILMNQKPDYA